jgi:hypothetical protein
MFSFWQRNLHQKNLLKSHYNISLTAEILQTVDEVVGTVGKKLSEENIETFKLFSFLLFWDKYFKHMQHNFVLQ